MTLPRPVAAVVFDMDGLLVDSERVYRDAMGEALETLGWSMSEALFRSMIGLSDHRALLFEHYGEDFPVVDFYGRVHDLAVARLAGGAPLKSGALELLDRIEALELPRAIATSSSHDTVRLHLGSSGLIERFHTVVARGDYARGKPAPDPYLSAAGRLGVDPARCLALEDSHNGVRAAAAAGMMTVMVPDLLEATGEMLELCVAIARDLHQVRGWI